MAWQQPSLNFIWRKNFQLSAGLVVVMLNHRLTYVFVGLSILIGMSVYFALYYFDVPLCVAASIRGSTQKLALDRPTRRFGDGYKEMG